MSYSFSIRPANKAELKSAISAELDKVVLQQPIHEIDRDTHEEAAGAMVDLVRDPYENEDMTASVAGSCWGDIADGKVKALNGGSINVSVGFTPK